MVNPYWKSGWISAAVTPDGVLVPVCFDLAGWQGVNSPVFNSFKVLCPDFYGYTCTSFYRIKRLKVPHLFVTAQKYEEMEV